MNWYNGKMFDTCTECKDEFPVERIKKIYIGGRVRYLCGVCRAELKKFDYRIKSPGLEISNLTFRSMKPASYLR